MVRTGSAAFWAATLLVLAGCSQARFVRVEGDQGVVAIPQNSDSWPAYNRRAADELMRFRFPQGVVIDREEEAVVGQEVTVDRTGNSDSLAHQVLGVGHERRTETTHNITEWHIHFHAKDAPAPPALPDRPVPVVGPRNPKDV